MISDIQTNLNGENNDTTIYNGYVEAVTTLLGALVVFAVGFIKLNWHKIGDFAVVFVSFMSGIFLLLMSGTDKIWLGYIG